MPFLRLETRELMSRLSERPVLIQILIGPRQAGKTTALSQVMAQALILAVQNKTQKDIDEDLEFYGRLAKNAVGAHLIRAGLEVFYWRHRDEEIDFIARRGKNVLAIEVGISQKKETNVLERAARKCGIAKTLLVGPGKTSLDEFLRSDPLSFL